MKNIITLCALLLLAITSTIAYGQTNRTKVVKFKRGTSGATYKDAVIRGETMTYVLGARKGQTMEVKISALENNAVFQIKDKRTGKYLSGAAEGEDARKWKGKLPSSGDYQIVVGGTRGNASFTISFEIK
ncbi:MAG TPA: hypothetical protein DCS93_04405 [Microscillaceae bacterium]|nr:hypothetical protein [Microscillaceae bacterium]